MRKWRWLSRNTPATKSDAALRDVAVSATVYTCRSGAYAPGWAPSERPLTTAWNGPTTLTPALIDGDQTTYGERSRFQSGGQR